MSSPQSPPVEYADEVVPATASSPTTPSTTRTVAIIKTHALKHRFEIEPRILEASFEIVKERQMEFDTEADPEFLYELFGEDTDSLAEGPVWVYVLERRRAVEVWNTLMGNRDPPIARDESPNSLRALFGISLAQNGLMGSPDVQMAEIQIASLFASSPPFPTSELPDDLGSEQYATNRSGDSTRASQRRRTTSDGVYARSSTSSAGGVRLGRNGKPLFKARALPKTHIAPDIAPRTTKAAALRAGIVLEKTPNVPRVAPTKAELTKVFLDVPGHKRSETIAVASTAPPIIAPRMTKAASLRLARDQPKPPSRIKSSTSSPAALKSRSKTADSPAKNTFEGVPGHKRSETFSVPSTAAPTIAPRPNRSATLRATKDVPPPSSFQFRSSSTTKMLGMVRSASQEPLSPPRPTSRPASVAGISRRTPSRQSVAADTIPASNNGGNVDDSAKPKKPRPTSLSVPSIAPKPNKSALLRAAKKDDALKGRTSTNRSVFV